MSAEDYSHLACPTLDCSASGQRAAGNLRLHGWSGRGQRIRCLHCATCGTDFSERANTPLQGIAHIHEREDKICILGLPERELPSK